MIKTKQLNDVCDIIMGQSPPSSTYNKEGKGYPFFQGKADFGEVFPIARVYCSEPQKFALENDILISVRAPVGDVNISTQKSCIGRGLAAIRAKEEVSYYKFIFYYLMFVKPQLENKGSGSTFKAISKKDVEEINVPLFLLETQKKIAEVLDKAQELINKRKEQLGELDNFLQSAFLDMFGDPVLNSKKWNKFKLGQKCDVFRGGSPRPIDEFLGGVVPWIKIGDATKGDSIYLSETKEHIIAEGVSKSRFVKKGSLIFANCGVSLGFARILKIDGCIHDGWLSFENIDSDINKIFLLKLLNHYTNYFRKSAPDGTQPNLNTKIMKDFEIPVPSLDLQNKFAQIVEKAERQRELFEKSLTEMENNFNSIMQKAFRGELFN